MAKKSKIKHPMPRVEKRTLSDSGFDKSLTRPVGVWGSQPLASIPIVPRDPVEYQPSKREIDIAKIKKEKLPDDKDKTGFFCDK